MDIIISWGIREKKQQSQFGRFSKGAAIFWRKNPANITNILKNSADALWN